MSSKRQLARNERTLQDLVKNVPGNSTCADCFARNPGWASWSLGIFLCMRCAGLHRKLGTHISKVKSLSMDSWTAEQVEFMKKTGNIASNRIYNPTNSKPNVPLDADEVDPALERYIRQKYIGKDLQGVKIQTQQRQDTGSTKSDERYERYERHSPQSPRSPQSPPPLPSKSSGGRFGLRSASSLFPMSSKAKKKAAADAREAAQVPYPPLEHNKPSRIFGSTVGESISQDFQSKMDVLRDMGFLDEQRNATILRGLNGNLERSIESLVRLGEGTKPVLPPRPATRATTSREPAGISFDTSPPPRQETRAHIQSNNPFDIPPPELQSSQSTGTLVQAQHVNGSNPYQTSMGSNPFDPVAPQSQYDINQLFQNLSVSNTSQSQTLFPHRTGGFPSQHPHLQKFLPSLETSVQAVPGQYPASAMTPYSSVYDFPPQPQNPQGNQQQQTYNNPFLQQARPLANGNGDHNLNPYLHHASTFPLTQQHPTNNPYAQQQQQPMQQSQQAPLSQPYDWQQPQQIFRCQQMPPSNQPMPPVQQHQSPQQPQQQWNTQQAQPSNPPQNPYQQQPSAQQHQYAQQQQYQYQAQQLVPQQTGRANKNDIMALFNHPQLAPQVPQPPPQQQKNESQPPNGQQQFPSNGQSQSFQSNGQGQSYQANGAGQSQAYSQQQNGTPNGQAPASNNPFMNSNGNGGGGGGGGKQSRESIMVEGGGWMNGRHSPDAFANLSSVQTRFMR